MIHYTNILSIIENNKMKIYFVFEISDNLLNSIPLNIKNNSKVDGKLL